MNPGEAGRIDFITWTHGTESSFIVSLEETPGQDIMFDVNIKEGYEDVNLIPVSRKPSITPGVRHLVAFSEIIDGGAIRIIDVNGYSDYIRFELSGGQSSGKVSFSFADTRPGGVGDYYYVKVNHSDDHTLWSSPIHVGGFDVE